MIIHNSNCLLK